MTYRSSNMAWIVSVFTLNFNDNRSNTREGNAKWEGGVTGGGWSSL